MASYKKGPMSRGAAGRERVGTAFPHFFHSNLTWRCVFLLRFPVCSSRRRV